MKTMSVLHAASLRDLVIQTNQSKIQREDVVGIFKDGEVFFLVYYK